MSKERLDRHDSIHHKLFDENTAQIGSLGDIVERHAGDAVFLTPEERSSGGADGGESDFEVEMLTADPADDDGEDTGDLYSSRDEDEIWSTDQTGTVEGIARGFGTHLPQDLGKEGFQIEEIPDRAIKYQSRIVVAGEELDDYDDEDDTNGKYDPGASLARASEPGFNRVEDSGDREPMPNRIPIRKRHAESSDDQLDATREIN